MYMGAGPSSVSAARDFNASPHTSNTWTAVGVGTTVVPSSEASSATSCRRVSILPHARPASSTMRRCRAESPSESCWRRRRYPLTIEAGDLHSWTTRPRELMYGVDGASTLAAREGAREAPPAPVAFPVQPPRFEDAYGEVWEEGIGQGRT